MGLHVDYLASVDCDFVVDGLKRVAVVELEVVVILKVVVARFLDFEYFFDWLAELVDFDYFCDPSVDLGIFRLYLTALGNLECLDWVVVEPRKI